jgi:hypothetical protein
MTTVASIAPIEIPKLGCPETLMPTPADMKNMIKQIAALPAKITALIQVQAATMAQDEIDGLMSEVEQLQEVVEQLLEVIDAPNFASIEWPDLRGEIGIDKLMQKYPTFLITEILKIIAKIIKFKFEIPIPPLPIKIDIIKFVGDKEYKAELIAKLTGNGPDITALLSELDPTALGLEAFTKKVDEIKASADLSPEEIKAQIAALPSAAEMATGAYMDKVNELKGAIIDPLYEILPPEWQSFGGEEGLEIPELKGQAVIAFIESKMSGLGVGILMDLIGKLISLFDKIWKLLGLPDLPIPLSLDIGAMIKEIVEAEKAKFTAAIEDLQSLTAAGKLEGLSEDVKAQIAALDKEALGEEAYNEAVEALAGSTLIDAKIAAFDTMGEAMLGGLESIKVAGFSVMDMIGGDIDDPVETLTLKKKRICEEIGRFKDNYVFFLLRKWMEIVTKFFKAIGLGKLVEFIGLDFCTFLGIIGFPKVVDLSFTEKIKEIGSDVTSALPTGFELTTEEQAMKDAADALPIFTATENQTTFSGTGDEGDALSYTAGETTVFKSGVSLEDYVIDETGDTLVLESSNEILRGEEGSVKDDMEFEVSSQYTATNGTSIVLTEPAVAGDVIFILTGGSS